jgi:hypothetical protein
LEVISSPGRYIVGFPGNSSYTFPRKFVSEYDLYGILRSFIFTMELSYVGRLRFYRQTKESATVASKQIRTNQDENRTNQNKSEQIREQIRTDENDSNASAA